MPNWVLMSFISLLDTTNFSLSLSGRRDRAFCSFRQLCMYLRKLAKRVVMPSELPQEDNLAKILDLDISKAPALSVTVFLNRTKFGTKLDRACKLKAEVEQPEMKGEKQPISELKEKAKEEFGRLARVMLRICLRRPAVTSISPPSLLKD